MRRRFFQWVLLTATCLSFTTVASEDGKPVFYIIGDSTVKNGKGKGDGDLWGWGSLLDSYFDTTRISVRNYALGGRSSRTFITEGHWDAVLSTLKSGDYVIMQFGHNDAGPLDDTARARGTIKGTGDETKDIYNPIMKKNETVHTYGWYLRMYVADIKARGATAIICSPVPRDRWVDGKCVRASGDYGKWAREVAEATGAYFIDLNNLIADEYDKWGPAMVNGFFPGDHTHTNAAGARVNAEAVVKGIKELERSGLTKYLSVRSQDMPKQKEVLQSMRLANTYFMNKWPDPGKEIVTNISRPSHIWTRAVYYEGLMALYSIDPQKKYYDYAVDWGEKHQWTPRNASRRTIPRLPGPLHANLLDRRVPHDLDAGGILQLRSDYRTYETRIRASFACDEHELVSPAASPEQIFRMHLPCVPPLVLRINVPEGGEGDVNPAARHGDQG